MTNLKILVWNVEHGSAIYAQTPNNRHIIMDAGKSQHFSPACWLHERYGLGQTDLFILSHADTDHIRDIENVDGLLRPHTFLRNRTAPRELIYPTYPPTTDPLKYFHAFDVRYCYEVSEESPYRLLPESNWGNVKIRTFFNTTPQHQFNKLNNYSVATFLLYNNLEFLFPGDLEAPGWEAIMRDQEFIRLATPSSKNKDEIRVLVAAHHGHEAGVYEPFLTVYQPHLTIISAKYGDSHVDYGSYYAASQGFSVYDRETKQGQLRYVVSTKMNDVVLVSVDNSSVEIII